MLFNLVIYLKFYPYWNHAIIRLIANPSIKISSYKSKTAFRQGVGSCPIAHHPIRVAPHSVRVAQHPVRIAKHSGRAEELFLFKTQKYKKLHRL